MDQNGIWLPIVEYSEYRNISISTVRRYIKGERVRFKKEDGKFLIFVSLENFQKKNASEKINLESQFEKQRLEMRLKELEEENNDLRMLVNIYESQKNISSKSIETQEELPELPL